MMAGFLGISYGQETVKEVPVLTADQQQAVDEVISMDPRLSAVEIEQLKLAVLGAPAKAEEANDPKLESQPEVVAAPWKAEPAEEREAVLPEPVSESTKSTQTQVGTQPEGEKSSERVINYRTIQGPQTQPEGEKSGTVINYRAIEGSNTQPEGEKPDDN